MIRVKDLKKERIRRHKFSSFPSISTQLGVLLSTQLGAQHKIGRRASSEYKNCDKEFEETGLSLFLVSVSRFAKISCIQRDLSSYKGKLGAVGALLIRLQTVKLLLGVSP